MGNLTVNRQGPEVFQDNEQGYHDTYTRGRDYRPQQPKLIEWRVYAVWLIAAIGGFLIFFLVYSIWKLFYCWGDVRYRICQRLDTAEPIVFLALLALPLVLVSINVLLKVWTRTRYENALANRANLVLNRYGDSEPADLYDRLDVAGLLTLLDARYASAARVELHNAPHKVYRGVNSLSIAHQAPMLTDGELDTPENDQMQPLAPSEWLLVADTQPHIMLAGSTGEGKTTAAKAILLSRLQAGELLFVIDPHSSNWYGIPGRAGGENWPDAIQAIEEIFMEYKARINERHQHLLVTGEEMSEHHFSRLNVLVDEAFLIKENLDTGSSKKQINYWSLLAEIMSSGARKIGISLILLTQTANVEDLGLSGPLRRNFFRIALDPPSIRTMITREESDHARRVELLNSIANLEFPATAEIRGQVYLLDRFGLLPMAQTPVDAKSCLWEAPSGRAFVRIGQAAQKQETSILEQLKALRAQGVKREEARAQGLVFDNDLWTLAGKV